MRAADIGQQRKHLHAGFGIQRTGRLVAQKQSRVFAQRTGDGHALLLAAGELGGEVVHAAAQTDLLHDGLRVERIFADLTRQLYVFKRGQVGHQVIKLKDEADVRPAVIRQLRAAQTGDLFAPDGDGAAGRLIHAAQEVEQRGLACAGRAENDAELPLLDGEIHVIQRFDDRVARLVILADVFKSDIAHGKPPFPCVKTNMRFRFYHA